MSEYQKDPERVAAGLKAALHNPNVSTEAKENAAERLENMGRSDINDNRSAHITTEDGAEVNRVIGGFKATLANENTSEEAKAHAREVLEAAGYQVERAQDTSEDEHNTRVLAGYKAAISNPNVSQKAKLHAEEYLRAHGAM